MPINLSKLSLHPRLAGLLDFLISLVFLYLLRFVAEWWWLSFWIAVRIVLWGLMLYLVYYAAQLKRLSHFISLGLFGLGSTLLLAFIDHNWPWYVMAVVFAIIPAVSFWLLPRADQNLSFNSKPERRIQLMMTTAGLAGLWAGSSASIAFHIFIGVPWWQWLGGAIIATLVSCFWWREYALAVRFPFVTAATAIFLLVLEFSWILSWWPVGYITSGLLQAWWWYVLWLLLRFYLSPEGIFSRRQSAFFILNALTLIISLIFIIRWR